MKWYLTRFAFGLFNTVWFFWAYRLEQDVMAPWLAAAMGPLLTITAFAVMEARISKDEVVEHAVWFADHAKTMLVSNGFLLVLSIVGFFVFDVRFWDVVKAAGVVTLATIPLQVISLRKVLRP